MLLKQDQRMKFLAIQTRHARGALKVLFGLDREAKRVIRSMSAIVRLNMLERVEDCAMRDSVEHEWNIFAALTFWFKL